MGGDTRDGVVHMGLIGECVSLCECIYVYVWKMCVCVCVCVGVC